MLLLILAASSTATMLTTVLNLLGGCTLMFVLGLWITLAIWASRIVVRVSLIAGSSASSRSWWRSAFSVVSSSICCCVFAGRSPKSISSRSWKRLCSPSWRNVISAQHARRTSPTIFRFALPAAVC